MSSITSASSGCSIGVSSSKSSTVASGSSTRCSSSNVSWLDAEAAGADNE
jgi:hypothetical protein